MVGRLTFLTAVIAELLLSNATVCLGQQAPQDPTRPPMAIETPASSTKDTLISSGLQTIIQRQGSRPQAVINGETYSLGDKVGEARLVKIDENSVVLQGPMGRETMSMTPDVTKKTSGLAIDKYRAVKSKPGKENEAK